MDGRSGMQRPVYRGRRRSVIAAAAGRVAARPLAVRATVDGEAFLDN
jgi:hypothetical protein